MLICDVNMPRMNGLEMLEKLRSDVRWKALPVVMLTTEGQPALIERAKKAGAQGWIIKPFKAALLVAAVQRLTA
jgi:two-component system chemotaxis response regulator CheY